MKRAMFLPLVLVMNFLTPSDAQVLFIVDTGEPTSRNAIVKQAKSQRFGVII